MAIPAMAPVEREDEDPVVESELELEPEPEPESEPELPWDDDVGDEEVPISNVVEGIVNWAFVPVTGHHIRITQQTA